jgi:predicted permease
MVRTARALHEVDPGFDTEDVLTFSIALPPVAYQPGERTAAFFHELTEAVRRLPGVTAAGAIDALPLAGGGPFLATTIEDRPLGPDEFPPAFHVRRVTPGYFEAMGIPVLDGRAFDVNDHAARLGTTMISTNIREKYWPDRSPLGRRIAPSSAFAEIVGVVGNVKTVGLDEPFDEFVYLPMVDSAGGAVTRMSFVVRAAGDPLALMPRIREEVRSRDANLPITGIGMLEGTVADSMAGTTFTTLLLVIAAGIALALGAVGIYGLISFIVGERTAEIGIRMSLGASTGSVMRLFLRQAWLLAGAGIVIGLIASLLATRLLQTLLFGISTFDALTWIFAPVLFFVVATLACLLPAHRAATVDPATAFRQS